MSNETNNPYQAPSSDVMDVPRDDINMGGSLESGIAGEYGFTIMGMLKEAWVKTNGMKGSFWVAIIILSIIMVVVSELLGLIFPPPVVAPGQMPGADLLIQMLPSQLIMSAVSAPFMLGLVMIGVKHSVERPISFKMIFSYFSLAIVAVIVSLLVMTLTVVGWLLFILPGLYLSVSYILTLPLVGDKKLSAWQAMEASRKAITKHWFKVFGLFLLMYLILIVSILPMTVGSLAAITGNVGLLLIIPLSIVLIWTFPMAFALIGILYREVFGVDSADEVI